MPSGLVKSHFKSPPANSPTWQRSRTNVSYGPIQVETDICSLFFEIPDNMKPPVLLYYRLTNFYQNHRRYVKSLDTDQLKGKAVSNSTIKSGSCDPLRLNSDGKAYYPCGLIANSLFNDTFESPILLNASSEPNETYTMTNKNIAWASDQKLYGKTAYTFDQVAPPPNWAAKYPNNYTADNPPPDLSQDQAFQVWMRTAGLPAFSKLALRNDNDMMKHGRYQVDIQSSSSLPHPFFSFETH